MMDVISTSETLVNFYQTTRRNIPEDSYLHTLRRQNLKSHTNFLKIGMMIIPPQVTAARTRYQRHQIYQHGDVETCQVVLRRLRYCL
jgi:hypothetical protein